MTARGSQSRSLCFALCTEWSVKQKIADLVRWQNYRTINLKHAAQLKSKNCIFLFFFHKGGRHLGRQLGKNGSFFLPASRIDRYGVAMTIAKNSY